MVLLLCLGMEELGLVQLRGVATKLGIRGGSTKLMSGLSGLGLGSRGGATSICGSISERLEKTARNLHFELEVAAVSGISTTQCHAIEAQAITAFRTCTALTPGRCFRCLGS